MKVLFFSFIITFLVTFINAVHIPEFNFQDIKAQFEKPIEEQSTDLITECGDSNDILLIKDITLSPDPPIKGEKLKIEFEGFLKDTVVDGAYVDIKVKFGVVQLLHKKFDFCAEIEKIDEKCPIEKGILAFTKEVDLPKQIPRGKYTVDAKVFTVDDRQVTCLHGLAYF
ncbi:unnamed protein product [Cunninghamella echinulata]